MSQPETGMSHMNGLPNRNLVTSVVNRYRTLDLDDESLPSSRSLIGESLSNARFL
jgi:hypothetical protein